MSGHEAPVEDGHRPRALILGCAGPRLRDDERALFAATQPLGFILFARNIETPDQVRTLTGALRAAIARPDAPILIDQEGGRVARLGPPSWPRYPAAARYGALYARDPAAGLDACRLGHQLIAADLAALGIDVDCAPVADVPVEGAHDIIGDRAFARDPNAVAALARAAADGLLAGGVLPVIKHIPGHGRASADSHKDLPVVDASLDVLRATDFAPFRALADLPLAMTAHVVYSAIDTGAPATLSDSVMARIIRGEIGFDGLVMSDDLTMAALTGPMGGRARRVLAAGCDLVLHCAPDLAEMREVANACPPMSDLAWGRWRRARALLDRAVAGRVAVQPKAARARLDALLAPVEGAAS